MTQNEQELRQTARAMVADGRGILAADESTSTATKRLENAGITSTIETRRRYRQLLFTTPGLGEYISGAILFDETIRQTADDGTPFTDVLEKQGIMPGIKVDTGAKPLAGSPDEKVTEGLDWLRDRLQEYVAMGARFTKWRAVIQIGDGLPTKACIEANAHAMARYAALVQEAGLVPIVEPEVLVDGDHTIEQSEEVTEITLRQTFDELLTQNVLLEGMVLKPNMVLPGTDSSQQASVEQVAEATVRCMRRVVPAAVPGIVFLSGGQDAVAATQHLNAMNQLGPHPWSVTFSYARALQGPAMDTWKGEEANVGQAQEVLAHRARCNGAASTGDYSQDMEEEFAAA
ncbi:MAG: fructose-bisphosphate aldolase class I [Actinomycetota bacterium]|nr:fructose-bisphosphate aldolase class I [Actinomycetota bacterium]